MLAVSLTSRVNVTSALSVVLLATCAFGLTSEARAATEVIAINAGSTVAVPPFVADADYVNGSSYAPGKNVTVPKGLINAAPIDVYKTARQGASTYTIPGLVAGNVYTVRLHFAELYFPAKGNRQFNILINGSMAYSNFDIVAAASFPLTAVVEDFANVSPVNNQIVIDFTRGAIDQPMVNGIEILAGATAAAPTITRQPVAATVAAGLTATFSVTASGTGTLTYQWYGNNAVISGATGSTYTTPAAAASNNGEMFYVKVSNSSGQFVNSSSVALTVTGAPTCHAAPSVPGTPGATATSSTQINVSWGASTAASPCTITYNVFRGKVSGFAPSASNEIAAGQAAASFADSGLAASTMYYYVVQAVDAFGASSFSAQTFATTSGSGTSEIVAINSGGGAVSNTTGGDVSFAADEFYDAGGTAPSGNAVTTAGIVNAAPEAVYDSERNGTFTYTIPGLTPGASYTVLLHFAETYFTATGSRVFNVNINGAATPQLANFDIYAEAGANTALVKQFTIAANAKGQIVIAYTGGPANFAKADGIEIRGVPSACTLLPSVAPTGLLATAASPSIINLTWTGVTPPPNCPVTYTLYRSTTSGFTPSASTLVASGLTNPVYANVGLTPSTTYYYVVEAVDGLGASPASASASTETHSATSCISTPAVAPADFAATASSSEAIGLSWLPITPPAYCTNITYNVYGSAASGFTPSVNNEIAVGLKRTSFVHSSLPALSTFSYVVQAVDEDGAATIFSGQASQSTLPPPTALTATAISPNQIDLTFPASTAVAPVQYLIFRSTSQPFLPSSSNQVGATKSNSYNDVVLSPGTRYYYQVEATSAAGSTTLPTMVSATTLPLGNDALFWDPSGIPATVPAGDVMTIKILNRTNGQFTDDQISWSTTVAGAAVSNTIAAQSIIEMPINNSARFYFYVGAPGQTPTSYFDFIEFTIGNGGNGLPFFNGNTTRVDAFGLKNAFQLACSDGTDIAVGENAATFAESRPSTFQRFLHAVPSNFQTLAEIQAPYRIVNPGAGGFGAGGPYAAYYNAWIDQIWSVNGITTPARSTVGANGDAVPLPPGTPVPPHYGLGDYPDLSAAIYRHVGGVAGSFNSDGTLKDKSLWGNPSTFYTTAPFSYYAQFLHANSINGQQYAFPYDDAGGYSGDVSCANPKSLILAVGW